MDFRHVSFGVAITRSYFRLTVVALWVPFALSACGGGGGSLQAMPPTTNVPPPAQGAPQATTVSVAITFPAQAAASSARGRTPFYVSPSIQSLAIAINGGAPIYVNAPAPPTTSPQTITKTVAAPPGNDLFSIAEYDRTDGAGNLLGNVMQMATVVIDKNNIISLTVNGELAKIVFQIVPSGFVEGSIAAGVTLVGNGAQSFLAVPEDADGNTIVAPGLVPTITETSAMPSAIVETAGSSNAFTLQAPAPTANVAITANGKNLEGNPVTAAFNANALAAIYIADYTVQKIRIFDENGLPLAFGSATPFGGVVDPMGLAYVPGSSGAPGTVLVTQTSSFLPALVSSYDVAGNLLSTPSTAFSGTVQPLFLTYGNGVVYVPNYYNSTLSEFTPTGTAIATPAGAFAGLAQPAAIAYDSHNANLYVTNFAGPSVTEYNSSTGATIATTTAMSHVTDIVYDPNNATLYATYAGTFVAALDQVQPVLTGVQQFSEADVASSPTGEFVNASTTAYFTGIAYDPYTKDLIVADAGSSKILEFTEAGASVTLPATAFTTINATGTVPSDPMGILLIP